MNVRKRLIAGFSATAVGPLITALVQVVSVPAFLSAWGPHLYGEWLIMSAVPTYLSISDIGFGSVAGNDMTIRAVRGDYDGALESFQSVWLFMNLISLLVGLIAWCIIFTAPIPQWLHVSLLSASQSRWVLAILSVYALGTLQGSILLSAFRSDGQYSFGVSCLNGVRLLENAGMLVSLLWLHASPVSIALAGAAVRVGGTALVFGLLSHKVPWIRLGFARATFLRIKDLTRPATAFMAFPAGNALSIQGMTVLIGVTLGPVAVATFTPMRTLSRFAYQIIDSIKNAVWPELSAAYGAENWPLARRLHRSCCQLALWLAIASVVGLGIAGPFIFGIWTKNRVRMDVPCFWILLIVVVASSLWNTSSAVSIAANLHERVAMQYLAGTAGSLFLAYLLMPRLQMAGAALALLAADVWMGCFVIRGSNQLLKDDVSDFVRAMLNPYKLKLLVAR